jgi:hypothetical protein
MARAAQGSAEAGHAGSVTSLKPQSAVRYNFHKSQRFDVNLGARFHTQP